jgi:hypothetical protein
MNAVTKTVRIEATIKLPMPGHILESLERVWADLDPTKDEGRSHYGAWRNVYPNGSILFDFKSWLRFPKLPRSPSLYVAQSQNQPI